MSGTLLLLTWLLIASIGGVAGWYWWYQRTKLPASFYQVLEDPDKLIAKLKEGNTGITDMGQQVSLQIVTDPTTGKRVVQATKKGTVVEGYPAAAPKKKAKASRKRRS